MKRWLFRGIIAMVGLIVAALPLTVDLDESKVTTTEAACDDCRPAPVRWKCDGVWESCPLDYEPCRKLPF